MPRQPNIIWIMADDLSWGDLGCYGQELIRTPNIDRLATEGMKFTQCYSGSTVCAPSRSSLMQGLHQGHATVRNNMARCYAGPLTPGAPGFEEAAVDPGQCHDYRHSLQPEDVTVAETLRAAGYATGMFGKWGLAVGDQPGVPNNKGFDEFFGYLNQRRAHNYYSEQLWRNRERVFYPQHRGHDHKKRNGYDAEGRIVLNGVESQDDLRYSFDECASASLDFVRANADHPFFLYLPYTPPHGALEVPELGEYTNRDWPLVEQKIWAAMISRMDSAVGDLLALLEAEGVDEDTLIFFTSDNGYSADGYVPGGALEKLFRNRGPWKGRKGNLHQGGVRVPTLARWPGRIAPGATSDHIWAFWDFLPTAAEAVGAELPGATDGVSVLPTLLGDTTRQEGREYLYWEFHNEQALRLDDWYVYRAAPDAPVAVTHANEDPEELRDLSAEKPELVRRAEEIFGAEHVSTPYAPDPGESRADWLRRVRDAGVSMPHNVDTW